MGRHAPCPILAVSSDTLDAETGGDLRQKLGKCKTGKGCLYINKLEDVDVNVLEAMMKMACK